MKIFISSLIAGFEQYRAAARAAVRSLGHEPIMAEDFGALPHSPQVACLQQLRSSDLVVLILGPSYGSVQGTSGVSPTHEEYDEARGAKPILMFVQSGVQREAKQDAFIAQAQDWQEGHFRAGLSNADELRELVTSALHRYELATAAGPMDVAGLRTASLALLPRLDRRHSQGPAMVHVAVAAGPSQQILRPADLEAPALAEELHQKALFGAQKIFEGSKGVDIGIEGSALALSQERGARIQLEENGSMLISLPLQRDRGGRGGQERGFAAMFGLVEEIVTRELFAAIAYADQVLERIDPTRKLTHVALCAAIEAEEHLAWRTQTEIDASQGGSIAMGFGGGPEKAPVQLDRPRAAIAFEKARLAEDLMVPLRRQWKHRSY